MLQLKSKMSELEHLRTNDQFYHELKDQVPGWPRYKNKIFWCKNAIWSDDESIVSFFQYELLTLD